MYIKSLKLKNFRSYRGESELDLSIDDNKNIILLGGENGAGKSSIFEAIKLCLYGPTTYKYQGMVPNYISKIKDLINEDAYYEENIEAFIELDINLNVKNNVENYKVRRTWRFDDTVLREEYIVKQNGKLLTEKEAHIFENYFKSVISPDVFDLFFFDGERLFEILDDSFTKNNLENIILTLNNYDIFSDLNKELKLSLRRRNRAKKELKDDIKEMEALENKKSRLEKEIKDIKKERDLMIDKHGNTAIKLELGEKRFKEAGGLGRSKRLGLIEEKNRLKARRDDINNKIKVFSNEILPFLMVKDKLSDLKEQIYMEDKVLAYESIRKELDSSEIELIIKKYIVDSNKDDIKDITNEILATLYPRDLNEEFTAIHFLSKKQIVDIIGFIEYINSIDISKVNYFQELGEISVRLAEIREILRESISETEEEEYFKEKHKLELLKIEQKNEIENLKSELARLEEKKEILENKLDKLKEKSLMILREDNVSLIVENIDNMTKDLLKNITSTKRREIEGYFNQIFSDIMRKSKFIDYIHIDNNFVITLYKNKLYKKDEIVQMIINLDFDELRKKQGNNFIKELEERSRGKSKQDILIYLNMQDKEYIELSTKVDVNKLSSGEKQIYVLSLYWALIKSSNIGLPFIIDTPYARIDEKHRKAITNKFFPYISHQVIVLSTNTELVGDLYEGIKERVSKEYILDYDVDSRSTKIRKGYF